MVLLTNGIALQAKEFERVGRAVIEPSALHSSHRGILDTLSNGFYDTLILEKDLVCPEHIRPVPSRKHMSEQSGSNLPTTQFATLYISCAFFVILILEFVVTILHVFPSHSHKLCQNEPHL